MNLGDKVRVIKGYQPNSSPPNNWVGVITARRGLDNGAETWWIDFGPIRGEDWAHEYRLEVIGHAGQGVTQNQTAAAPANRTESNMVYRTTVILNPTVKAQESGAVEKVLVDNKTVVAGSELGAAFLAGVQSPNVLKDTDGGLITVIVKSAQS